MFSSEDWDSDPDYTLNTPKRPSTKRPSRKPPSKRPSSKNPKNVGREKIPKIVPERNKLQMVCIKVGTVHHIKNDPAVKELSITHVYVTKDWNQSAPFLLFSNPYDYHIIIIEPNNEMGVLVNKQKNPELYNNLVEGQVILALKATEMKKHRILVKEGERLNIIATPGHMYAVEIDGDVLNESFYSLEHGNDLYISPVKGRRYVIDVPEKDQKAKRTQRVAASYIIIQSIPK